MSKQLIIGLAFLVLVGAGFAVIHQRMAARRLAAQVEWQEERGAVSAADRLAARLGSSGHSVSQRNGVVGDAAGLHSEQGTPSASESGMTTEQTESSDDAASAIGARRNNRRNAGVVGQSGEGSENPSSPGTAAGALNADPATASRRNRISSEEREKQLAEAAAQSRERSKALLTQAQQRIRDGNFTEAEELLQQSLENDLGNARAWKQMAQLQRQMGSYDAEIGTYQQWLENVPGDAEPYYLMADAYARTGMDAEALQYLAAYEGMAEGTKTDYVRLSHLYRRMNYREDEGRILSQWVAATPESMDARNSWAEYQRRMGNYGEALTQYEYIASMTPDNPSPYRQMAEVYRRSGAYDQAQQYYETALAMRPGDISTMNRLADLHYSSGDLNGALNVYTEIMSLEPGTRAAEQAARRVTQIERRLSLQQ